LLITFLIECHFSSFQFFIFSQEEKEVICLKSKKKKKTFRLAENFSLNNINKTFAMSKIQITSFCAEKKSFCEYNEEMVLFFKTFCFCSFQKIQNIFKVKILIKTKAGKHGQR
jgi:hypothetical protein